MRGKRTELKTLGGISRHLFAIKDEGDMKNFRQFLFSQTDPRLRPALIQLRLYDLKDKERKEMEENDMRVIEKEPLSGPLKSAAAKDPDISSYVASILSLRGMSSDSDVRIKNIITGLESEVTEGPVSIDLAQIEILAATLSPDRNRERLNAEIKKATSMFKKAGIAPPDVEVILIPPVISALAANCDGTAPEESGLRSGRYYQDDNVILIADDRSVINTNLLIHEMVHAKQNEKNQARAEHLDPSLRSITEAVTEAVVLKINPNHQIYPEDRKIINRIKKLVPESEFEKITLAPANKIPELLATHIFKGNGFSDSDIKHEIKKLAR